MQPTAALAAARSNARRDKEANEEERRREREKDQVGMAVDAGAWKRRFVSRAR